STRQDLSIDTNLEREKNLLSVASISPDLGDLNAFKFNSTRNDETSETTALLGPNVHTHAHDANSTWGSVCEYRRMIISPVRSQDRLASCELQGIMPFYPIEKANLLKDEETNSKINYSCDQDIFQLSS
uniref:Uncharacterized protein n=1 Tax=Romanomermis culicivorax TaxID=13658 RepID=A0A915KJU9_ROMCU